MPKPVNSLKNMECFANVLSVEPGILERAKNEAASLTYNKFDIKDNLITQTQNIREKGKSITLIWELNIEDKTPLIIYNPFTSKTPLKLNTSPGTPPRSKWRVMMSLPVSLQSEQKPKPQFPPWIVEEESSESGHSLTELDVL